MDRQNPDDIDDRVFAETPEDVAVLYSWANLQGAKYRDFSASRREFRAQMRKRAAEAEREAELQAKAAAEEAAAASERAAREAEEAARFHESEARKAAEEMRSQDSQVEQQARARAMQHAAELSRRAAAERMEAARRSEAVIAAEAAAKREAREMTEARASAQRQAARYAESETLRRALTGPQPAPAVHGVMADPYGTHISRPERVYREPAVSEVDMRAGRLPRTREERHVVPQPEESAIVREEQEYWNTLPAEHGSHAVDLEVGPPVHEARDAHDTHESAERPVNYYYEPDSEEKVAAVDQYAQYAPYTGQAPAAAFEEEQPLPRPQGFQPDEPSGIHRSLHRKVEQVAEPEGKASVPAWLDAPREGAPVVEHRAPHAEPRIRPLPPPVADTLQHSRERVAARWYALKGIFDQGVEEPKQPPPRQEKPKEVRAPLTAIFSIAGGVGKTSMVATLGRTLSSLGEKVLLVDTTLHGLLPFYFGASELRPGVVRTFSPPSGSSDASIALVSFDVAQKHGDGAAQEVFVEELMRSAQDVQRVLLDLSSAAPWVVRRLANMNARVLIPVAPDMNSVISLGAVDRFFAGMADSEGRPVQPYYLLNGFDASLPLHLDVREVMRQQLGDRLLQFVIRRSPAVSEALAEGMTVMDYAPSAPVAGDYMNLASWLRTQSSPALSGFKNARWSER